MKIFFDRFLHGFVGCLIGILIGTSFLSCDNFVEETPSKVEYTKYLEVHHSSLDEVDLERLDRWFGELCSYYDENRGLCNFMGQKGRTRLIFDRCENVRGRSGWRVNGFTDNRASAKIKGDGTIIVVCNLTKELLLEEFSHAMMLEYQNSSLAISRTTLEACAVGMKENLGARKRNWEQVTSGND